MLNIKQAKPGVSGPDATRAALQGSRESPRVYMAGLGWGGGRGAKLRMLSAKYPHCLNHRGLGSGEVLVRGQFLRHLFCRLTGEVFPSSNISSARGISGILISSPGRPEPT